MMALQREMHIWYTWRLSEGPCHMLVDLHCHVFCKKLKSRGCHNWSRENIFSKPEITCWASTPLMDHYLLQFHWNVPMAAQLKFHVQIFCHCLMLATGMKAAWLVYFMTLPIDTIHQQLLLGIWLHTMMKLWLVIHWGVTQQGRCNWCIFHLQNWVPFSSQKRRAGYVALP